MERKAMNGIGPGAGKGAKREAEERAFANARKRRRELEDYARDVAFERVSLEGRNHA